MGIYTHIVYPYIYPWVGFEAKLCRKNHTRPLRLLRPEENIDVGTCNGHCANADADKL